MMVWNNLNLNLNVNFDKSEKESFLVMVELN